MYKKAQEHFKKADAKLHKASLDFKIGDIRRSKDVFRDIVRAIAGQQLSGKAAETIFGRLVTLVGKGGVTPKTVLAQSDADLRACGLSGAKARAIRSLAESVAAGKFDPELIHTHEDAEVIAKLTSVKGIGPWTAEMILMFSLGRRDVFSKGDLGLRKGVMHLYGLRKMPTDAFLDKVSKAWSPYRTYAARVLWRVADAAAGKSPKS
jgi:DNA-3-methyladenine glycosylase II